jgi:hypothetical protein
MSFKNKLKKTKLHLFLLTTLITVIIYILIRFSDILLPFDYVKNFIYMDFVTFEHKKDPFRLLSINIFITLFYDQKLLFMHEFVHTNLYLTPWDPYKLIIPLFCSYILIYRTVYEVFLTFLNDTEPLIQRCIQLCIVIISYIYVFFTAYYSLYVLSFIVQDYTTGFVTWEIKTIDKIDEPEDLFRNIAERKAEKDSNNFKNDDNSENN